MNDLLLGADPWLSVGEAAKLLGVTRETVKKWEKEGRGLACVRTPAGHRRYRLSEVVAFMAGPKART